MNAFQTPSAAFDRAILDSVSAEIDVLLKKSKQPLVRRHNISRVWPSTALKGIYMATRKPAVGTDTKPTAKPTAARKPPASGRITHLVGTSLDVTP